MSELLREAHGEDFLEVFYMKSIDVDGILSTKKNKFLGLMFSFKYLHDLDHVGDDGYVDDTDEEVAWDSPQVVFFDEIVDEDIWVYAGLLLQPGNDMYQKAQRIAKARKAEIFG